MRTWDFTVAPHLCGYGYSCQKTIKSSSTCPNCQLEMKAPSRFRTVLLVSSFEAVCGSERTLSWGNGSKRTLMKPQRPFVENTGSDGWKIGRTLLRWPNG